MHLTTDHVRELISRNAALARLMGDLAIDAANVASALASRGAPASEAFFHGLGEASRLFAALRTETFAAAASLDLPLPPLNRVDSTSDLEAMLEALLKSVEATECRAVIPAAHAAVLQTLDRVALLGHRDHSDFEPLRACREQARELRAAIAETTEVDAIAIKPFAALVRFIDSQQNLEDEQWGELQATVTAAFGSSLAMAAGRGRLVSASPTATTGEP
jgi:hypothetical protein